MSTDVKDAAEALDHLEDAGEAKQVFAAACRLPKAARSEIVTALIRTLDEEEEDPAEVEAAWDKELLRRLEALRAGRLETVSVAEVMADLDAIVNEAREA